MCGVNLTLAQIKASLLASTPRGPASTFALVRQSEKAPRGSIHHVLDKNWQQNEEMQ